MRRQWTSSERQQSSAKGQKKISTVSSEVFCPPGAKLQSYALRGKLFCGAQRALGNPRMFSLAKLAAVICASVVSASEHVCCSYVPHPSLLQLVDQTNPEPVIITNDSVFMMDLGATVDSSIHLKKGLSLIFLWNLNHFPFAQGGITFVFIRVYELLSHMVLSSSYSLLAALIIPVM